MKDQTPWTGNQGHGPGVQKAETEVKEKITPGDSLEGLFAELEGKIGELERTLREMPLQPPLSPPSVMRKHGLEGLKEEQALIIERLEAERELSNRNSSISEQVQNIRVKERNDCIAALQTKFDTMTAELHTNVTALEIELAEVKKGEVHKQDTAIEEAPAPLASVCPLQGKHPGKECLCGSCAGIDACFPCHGARSAMGIDQCFGLRVYCNSYTHADEPPAPPTQDEGVSLVRDVENADDLFHANESLKRELHEASAKADQVLCDAITTREARIAALEADLAELEGGGSIVKNCGPLLELEEQLCKECINPVVLEMAAIRAVLGAKLDELIVAKVEALLVDLRLANDTGSWMTCPEAIVVLAELETANARITELGAELEEANLVACNPSGWRSPVERPGELGLQKGKGDQDMSTGPYPYNVQIEAVGPDGKTIDSTFVENYSTEDGAVKGVADVAEAWVKFGKIKALLGI